jgi:multidrug efflux pump subunit AcrA (membrane-fusion protein)
VTLQNDEQDVTTATTTVALDRQSIGATIEADEASVEAASVTLSSAELSLSEASLTSPIAGTVTSVNAAVGNPVSAGSTTLGSSSSSSSGSSGTGSSATGSSASSSGSTGSSSSTALFEIVSTGVFEAQASITGSDVSEVQVGDQVDLTLTGSATPIYGTVSSLGIVATVSSGVASFPVVVVVTGDPAGLYSGMSADASIIVLERANVLTVPSSAVHTLGTASFVYELKGGKEVEHTVGVGAVGTTLTQITSGLKSGQEVVLANLSIPLSTGSSTSGGLGSGFTGTGGLGGGGFGGGRFGGGGLGGGLGGG